MYVPYFDPLYLQYTSIIILLGLTPHNFTHQGASFTAIGLMIY
jgi:hypothetical protein